MKMLAPVDEGLQVERTFLAWTRTLLAVVTATALMARLTLGSAGWTVLFLGGGVVTAVAGRRPRATAGVAAARVISKRAGHMPDARLAAVTSVLVLTMAVLESVYLLRGWL